MYQIRKSFRFEASHVLTDSYSEECRNIHGHSYLCEVFIRTEILNNSDMVIDFKQLKKIVQPLIDEWDHSLIVDEESIDVDNPLLKSFKVICVDWNPTAENMAKFIYDFIKARTNKIHKVRVHETETGYAEYWEE